jgi:biopolymer transport protein ExbD
MAFDGFEGASSHRAMSEINMVPLIDVVLVLLVLFILAAPMAAQSVKVTIPKTAASPPDQATVSINVYLQPDGRIFDQQGQPLDVSSMRKPGELAPNEQPTTVRIWSDKDVRYELLANLIVDVRKQGYSQISLMTQP